MVALSLLILIVVSPVKCCRSFSFPFDREATSLYYIFILVKLYFTFIVYIIVTIINI